MRSKAGLIGFVSALAALLVLLLLFPSLLSGSWADAGSSSAEPIATNRKPASVDKAASNHGARKAVISAGDKSVRVFVRSSSEPVPKARIRIRMRGADKTLWEGICNKDGVCKATVPIQVGSQKGELPRPMFVTASANGYCTAARDLGQTQDSLIFRLEPSRIQVRLRVRTVSNQAAPGIRVQAQDLVSSQLFVAETRTDASGETVLHVPGNGSYEFDCEALGFGLSPARGSNQSSGAVLIEAIGGSEAHVDLVLLPIRAVGARVQGGLRGAVCFAAVPSTRNTSPLLKAKLDSWSLSFSKKWGDQFSSVFIEPRPPSKARLPIPLYFRRNDCGVVRHMAHSQPVDEFDGGEVLVLSGHPEALGIVHLVVLDDKGRPWDEVKKRFCLAAQTQKGLWSYEFDAFGVASVPAGKYRIRPLLTGLAEAFSTLRKKVIVNPSAPTRLTLQAKTRIRFLKVGFKTSAGTAYLGPVGMRLARSPHPVLSIPAARQGMEYEVAIPGDAVAVWTGRSVDGKPCVVEQPLVKTASDRCVITFRR